MLNVGILLLSWIQCSGLLQLFGVRKVRQEGFVFSTWQSQAKCDRTSVWFHAASLGELEMLRPLIEDFHQRGHRIGVSSFSDSALKGLELIKPIALYAGLSPRESEWLPLFQHFKVKKLILAKYDFWPGLMRAASVTKAPVIVINAQDRKSLRRLRQIFRLSFTRFPELHLYANEKKRAEQLFSEYGQVAEVALGPDPRWERVARRKENAIYDGRLKHYFDQISRMKGSIGVIGSAWLSDLEVLVPALDPAIHSVVVVPHDLSPENLKGIHAFLSSRLPAEQYLVIEEMGLLTEIYEAADWAWVGGGFGKGIHSLIEPSLFDIPIACGPKNFELFPEASLLQEKKLVTLCRTQEDAKAWLSRSAGQPSPALNIAEMRQAYRALLEECIRIE